MAKDQRRPARKEEQEDGRGKKGMGKERGARTPTARKAPKRGGKRSDDESN